jgi:DNA-binding CsgD family transcriptional regulator/tetratricopeptide (TPR) repeat protein
VYDDLLPGERVRLHAAYVQALAMRDTPGTAAELARHARAAHDLVTAVRAGIRAGDEAIIVGGPDEASHHYEVALELLADPDVAAAVRAKNDEPFDSVGLVLRACAATVAAGHLYRALGLAQDQLKALPADASPFDRARLLNEVARTGLLGDTRLDILDLTTEAISLLPEEQSELRAELLTVHARANADRSRDEEAARWACAAEDMARELGRPDIAVDAATTLARLEQRAGDPDRAELALTQAVAESHATGQSATELRGLFSLATLYYETGRLQRALETFQQSWSRAESAGMPWVPYGLESRALTALVALVAGEWEVAARAVDTTAGDPPPELAAALLGAVGMELAAGRGDTSAVEQLGRIRPWWQREGMLAIVSGGAAIELYGQLGDLKTARAVHDDVVSSVALVWQRTDFMARIRLNALLLGQVASAVAVAGESERADLCRYGDELAASAGDVAASVGRRVQRPGPESEAWLARVEAERLRLHWLADSEDRPPGDDLVAAWRRTVACFERFGHVYETARSRIRLAAVLRATGDSAGAVEQLARARVVAKRLGAQPLLTELRTLGGRPAPGRGVAGARHDEGLTPREHEVLTLVAHGRSNGEIARHLFISVKTVSVHVSNIMAKLGAGSRTEAAAVARRQGLLSDAGEPAGRQPQA